MASRTRSSLGRLQWMLSLSADVAALTTLTTPASDRPPPNQTRIATSVAKNVAAGHDVNNPPPFPSEDSAASQIVRLQTAVKYVAAEPLRSACGHGLPRGCDDEPKALGA
ncbi:hypothetical protein C8R46DRAFT_1221793 [Mycena filopes]|nr:hypothetical protein C8R46DRAFT_1221793 [Mycena filopes]